MRRHAFFQRVTRQNVHLSNSQKGSLSSMWQWKLVFFISVSQKTTLSGQRSEECPDEGVNRDRQNANNQNAKTHKNNNAKIHKNHNAKTHQTQEKLRQTHISYSSATSCCWIYGAPLSGIPLPMAIDAIPHWGAGSIPAKLVGASRWNGPIALAAARRVAATRYILWCRLLFSCGDRGVSHGAARGLGSRW